jgi:very-short-patch-repair endonuclease
VKPLGRIRQLKRVSSGDRFTKEGELAKTVRPTTPTGLQLGRIEKTSPVISIRRGITYADDKRGRLEKRAISINSVYGSLEERIFFRALLGRKLKPHLHFIFQASMDGARPRGMRVAGRQIGGIVADFVFLDRPLVVQVQGTFWHSGRTHELRDRLQVQRLNERGWEVRYIWDWELHSETLTEEWLKRNIDIRVLGSAPAGAAPFITGSGGWIG